MLARRLRQLQRAYSSITLVDFARAVGYPNPNQVTADILSRIQWPVDGQFVEPQDNLLFRKLLAEAAKPEFGAEESKNGWAVEEEKKEQWSAETLQRLVTHANFLDRAL